MYRAVGAGYLYSHGGHESRIGHNKRNPQLEKYEKIEKTFDRVAMENDLVVTMDVKQIHPPFFTEFSYQDTLGGISLNTLSAEITCRMSKLASQDTAEKQFPVDAALDKYVLQQNPYKKKHRKVIFLCGSNAMEYVDQAALYKLMTNDPEWVIKCHPVTKDDTIRELAAVYGYHRIIGPNIGGMSILHNAEYVATLSTSEFMLVAVLLGKTVIDISNPITSIFTCYYRYARLLTGHIDYDRQVINNALMSRYSGHIRPEYGEAQWETMFLDYCTKALELREPFRMTTGQKLKVDTNIITNWNPK